MPSLLRSTIVNVSRNVDTCKSGRRGRGAQMSYRVATVDELQDIAYRQDTHMRPVRHHLGITAFGTNAWTANAGDRLMPEHREDEGTEELYVVLRGRARFEIDGDRVDAPAGTLVFVGPEGTRTAFAEEAGTTVLAIGSRAGRPYEVGGWEVWAEFAPAYEAGDYHGVIARGRRTLEASGYASPLYNLACCEALAGRTEDAIGHLRVAFERRPSLRDTAISDTDLDSLRDEAAFRELVG
jgi:mannose-6-phosphate isomerase-like protein (cupin superfamily)